MLDLRQGDCLDVLATLDECSVDTCVTDPPYGYSFMQSTWDHGVPGVPFWQAVMRVLKPGAMLLAFGGTRTYHRLACGIEDAGFEIRDCLCWLYGQGFPKSLDISKAIDKANGVQRVDCGPSPRASQQTAKNGTSAFGDFKGSPRTTHPATDLARTWNGYGTALKPAYEPVVLAMKPLDGTFANNAEKWNVAGLNVDGTRIDVGDLVQETDGCNSSYTGGWSRPYADGDGRKMVSKGRFPANVVLDREAAELVDADSGSVGGGFGVHGDQSNRVATGSWHDLRRGEVCGHGDSGGASRFFFVEGRDEATDNPEPQLRFKYAAKASKRDRTCNGAVENRHPTVKPTSVMEWLVTLTKTPTGGVVLDPFMGSGTTGVACARMGRSFIGIERDAEHFATAKARIEATEKAA